MNLDEGIVPVKIEKFGGIDTLADIIDTPLGTTDDALNVYGYGDYVQKRHGMTRLTTAPVGAGNAIYDMIHGGGLSGTSPGRDSLFMIYNRGVAVPGWAYFDLFTGGVLHDMGAIVSAGGFLDASFHQKIVQAGISMMTITPTANAADANHTKIQVNPAGIPDYQNLAMVAGPAENGYLAAAWHRSTLFWAGPATSNVITRLRWSDFNLPETYTAANNVDLDPNGRDGLLTGVISTEDVLYVISTRAFWALTGTTAETFRLERFFSDYGGFEIGRAHV